MSRLSAERRVAGRPGDPEEGETSMSSTEGRGAATIHAFPAGGRGRSGGAAVRGEGQVASIARLFPPVAVVEFGSGWYHAAAIDEADAGRTH
jgi:hypothetical protein